MMGQTLNLCVQVCNDKLLSGIRSLNDSVGQGFESSPAFYHWVPSTTLLLQMRWIWVSGSEYLCILETLTECHYTNVFIVTKNANLGRLCSASQWRFVKWHSTVKSFVVDV